MELWTHSRPSPQAATLLTVILVISVFAVTAASTDSLPLLCSAASDCYTHTLPESFIVLPRCNETTGRQSCTEADGAYMNGNEQTENLGMRRLQQSLQLPNCIPYDNPVLPFDFPDPSSPVQGSDGYFYIFATNGGTPVRNVQVARAPAAALGQWTLLSYDALPVVHSWSSPYNGLVWAPEVAVINGLYVMYVTLQYTATGVPAIGIATSLTAWGPYVPYDTGRPLVSQYGILGSLDAFPFQDLDGSRYLYYRAPGPDLIVPSIYVQGLAADGLSVTGVVSTLLSPTDPWEMYDSVVGVIEGPAVTKCYSNTAICLLYSGSPTQTDHYATGYAVATNPLGPFTKYPGNPILATGGGVLGPGGPSFLLPGDGRIYTMYHSWESMAYTKRELNMVLLDLNAGTSYSDMNSAVPVSVVDPTWQVPVCQ